MSTRTAIDWTAIKARIEESQAAMDQNLVVEGDRLRQVFCDRAWQLATRSAVSDRPRDAWPALTFSVGGERYCIALTSAVEVLRCACLAPLPGAPPQLLGVVNVRGQICSVLDLARLLELPESGESTRQYAVLVRHRNIDVGLAIDEVGQVATISPAEVAAASGELLALAPQYVRGRTPDGVAILDMDAIFSHPVFLSGRESAARSTTGSGDYSTATSLAALQVPGPKFFGDHS
ncbi:MAG TPA: chemotaxis protein CheW [Pirellulales bacterium]|jgi:purine-binding chemotaxis protein CheW|nr:chemotaxis protein CheW [Pirellulales bacterium]